MTVLQCRPASLAARILCAALAALVCVNCRVTETSQPVHTPDPEIRRGKAVRVWNVIAEGTVQGEVVLFAAAEESADSLYMVRNVWQQDLGLIDSLGRAYRFTPHAAEPRWVGTGTVSQGAARILQLEGACSLLEVTIDLLPAPEPPSDAPH